MTTIERTDQTEPELTDGQAALRALLPLAMDIGVPIGTYYLLQNLGASTVMSLAVSGLVPAARTLWSVLRKGKADPLALLVLGVTVIGIPLTFLTGSAQFVLVKESFGTLPMGVWVIVSALRSRPVMAAAAKAFIARTGAKSAAWDHLAVHSDQFRRYLNNASMVWGIGFLAEVVARLGIIYTQPIDTAVWATNIPLFAMIIGCTIVAHRWMEPAEEMVKAHVAAA